MAIAFRAAGEIVSIASTESPEIPAPDGLQDGDLVIVAIMTATTNGGDSDQSGAGWTRLSIQNQGSTGSMFVLYKIADGEGESWTFTDLFNGTELTLGVAVAYSGVDTTTPLDVEHISDDLGDVSGSDDTAAITPTSDGAMIVSIFGADGAEAVTGTADSSPACTERADGYYAGVYTWIYIQDHLQSTAAAEAHTATPSVAQGVCYKLLALRPAAGAGGETISAECADGLTFADSDVVKATLQAVVADGLATSDADSNLKRMVAALTDGSVFSDSSAVVRTFYGLVSDGSTFAEGLTPFLQLLASVADGVKFSDAASLGGIISALAADGIVLSDAAAAGFSLLAQIADGVTFSDSGAVNATFSVTAADGVEFADLVAVLARLGATVSDSITLSDTSREASTLVPGIMHVSFTAGQATMTFSVSKPTITFTGIT